jgi:formate-nitrite transporter family protein
MRTKLSSKDEKAESSEAHLSKEEKRLAQEHASPRAVVIHEIIRADGQQELERTTVALILSGAAAGLSMGFSFLAEAMLRMELPVEPWRHLIESAGYSVGFIIVVLGRQQLFTESTLTAVLPLLTNRDLKTFVRLIRLFTIVLVANLAGTWLFASLLQIKSVFPESTTAALEELARLAAPEGFGVMFIRSILSGWLIALMVWILPAAHSERLLTVFVITYVVGLGGFSHIVAGSTEASYSVLAGFSTLKDYFLGFALPTVLGNTIGGVALVSILNHGSIAPEIGRA